VGALDEQLPLERGDRREHVEDKAPLRGGGVDGLLQDDQAGALRLEEGGQVEERPQRAHGADSRVITSVSPGRSSSLTLSSSGRMASFPDAFSMNI